MSRQILKEIIDNFQIEKFNRFFRAKSDKFKLTNEIIPQEKSENFDDGLKIGEIEFENEGILAIYTFPVKRELFERSGKKAQYELGKYILKNTNTDAGIFVFYDKTGNFRFSLIYTNYLGRRRDWSTFRRFTYFVSPELTNKTFLQRIGEGDFSSLAKIKEAFSVEKVTKEFYKDIANWYFWAVDHCRFPKDAEAEENGRNVAVIRLITRMIFIWFMRERGLVPKELFEEDNIKTILKDNNPQSSSYYKAILQNLFFATLSTKKEERKFRDERRFHKGYNPDFGNQYVFRYHDLFTNPEKIKDYFGDIPFLNGGLFECLDDGRNGLYIDGFTERKKEYQPQVPNFLFFIGEIKADLNAHYGTKGKDYKVRGLFNIFSSFNFTIDENSSDDADIALDPELLGRIFENLLASFNPETATSARKATGSYYTPREIVDYMVKESLKEYFKMHLPNIENLNEKLEKLFSTGSDENPFSNTESEKLVNLIESVRIVDPAVGSGAFPMGALNKTVFILNKLDPGNELWKQAQLKAADVIPDLEVRGRVKEQIEKFFKEKNPDYGRKLYLIQKCFYGVDIQKIAVEITKLRFFISLLVDEKIDKYKENWGIEPLPNLDFKIMQGNSLISEFLGIDFDKEAEQTQNETLFAEEDPLIKTFEQKKNEFQNEAYKDKKDDLKTEIENLMIQIFEANIKKQKADYFRQMEEIERKYSTLPNKKTREETIAQEKQKLSKTTGFDLEKIEKQLREFTSKNKTKPFFPWKLYFAEVFKKGGFDIVIANPPYIQLQKALDENRKYADLYKDAGYETFDRTGDIYCLFYEKGIALLRHKGILAYISSNKWMRAGYGKKLRRFFLKYNPLQLIDLGPGVFESATVDTNIILIQKAPNQHQLRAVIYKDKTVPFFQVIKEKGVILSKLDENAWFIGSDAERKLKEKIERIGKPLKDWDVKIYYGIKTGLNEAFIIDSQKREEILANCKDEDERRRTEATIKPILRGRDIKRYYYEWAGLWVIVAKFGFYKEAHLYSSIVSHLSEYKNELKKRGQCLYNRQNVRQKNSDYPGQHHWLELDNNPKDYYLSEFEKEKVVWQRITQEPTFCLVEPNIFVLDSMAFFTGENLKYIMSILNSKLIYHYVEMIVHQYGYTGYRLSNQYVEIMPLPPITPAIQPIVTQIEHLVDRISETKRKDKSADTTDYEKQIDQLVYGLYGLTPDEIKIVEEKGV